DDGDEAERERVLEPFEDLRQYRFLLLGEAEVAGEQVAHVLVEAGVREEERDLLGGGVFEAALVLFVPLVPGGLEGDQLLVGGHAVGAPPADLFVVASDLSLLFFDLGWDVALAAEEQVAEA